MYHAPQVLHPSHMDKAGKLSFLVKAKGIRRGRRWLRALWRALAAFSPRNGHRSPRSGDDCPGRAPADGNRNRRLPNYGL